jgi:hypothetical protein
MTGSARYLVAVTRGLSGDALDGTDALRGSPLRLLELGDVQAVVCDVDLDEFGEEPLRRNLEDLSWLEEMARAHHAAVSAVAGIGTTVPMRFATIYESDDRVAEQIESLRGDLVAAMDRVEGCAEWSVKVYAVKGASTDPPEPTPQSGSAYLMRKREEAQERRVREERDAVILSGIHEALTSRAVASRMLMPQDPRLTQRHDPMRMNAAYLVADAATESFLESAQNALLDHPDLRVEVGGPWPPYSFASLESG